MSQVLGGTAACPRMTHQREHPFVELMPPGSPCSIALTEGYVDSGPGCLKAVRLGVENVGEVLAFLRDRYVSVRGP